jgi:hexokinase
MSCIAERTDDFLREIGMHPDLTDIAGTAHDFRSKMDAGLRGEPGGLPMLPTWLRTAGRLADEEPVLILDAGGTHLRRALVEFQDGRPSIRGQAVMPVPGSRGEITWDMFLEQTAAFLLPLLGESRRIALCYSYPAEILPDLDGVATAFCKEVRVRGAAGRTMRSGFLSCLRALGGGGDWRFLVLNDAAATALGGLALTGEHERLAGLVLGTGFNICCPFPGGQIRKAPRAGDMLVNLEAGCYGGAAGGLSDAALDARSELPGDHLLEKMLAGAYHGGLMALTASLCAVRGLLSDGFLAAESFSPADAEAFARGKLSPLDNLCQSLDDRAALRVIIDRSYERAGKLLCACLSAVVSAAGGPAVAPYRVALEGSAILKSSLLMRKLRRFVSENITAKTNVRLDFIEGEGLTLPGAAAASLLCQP